MANRDSSSPDRQPSPASVIDAAAGALSTPAERALAEARQRHAEIEARVAAMPKEENGRKGLEPVRYGDWEVKGIATDF